MHNTGMDIFYVRAAILIISIGSIVWGGMISFSERFFADWQNTHWKESNNRQWADTSSKANRLGVGLGAFVFGMTLPTSFYSKPKFIHFTTFVERKFLVGRLPVRRLRATEIAFTKILFSNEEFKC